MEIAKNTKQWNQTRQTFVENNYNLEFSISSLENKNLNTSINGPTSSIARNCTLPEYTLSGKLSALDWF